MALILDRARIVLAAASLNLVAAHFPRSSQSGSKQIFSSTEQLLCGRAVQIKRYLCINREKGQTFIIMVWGCRTRQRSTIWWAYLSWIYIGCIWRLHSIGSLMWLGVNKWLGHFSLSCTLTFLFIKKKMRALLPQKLGCIALLRQGAGSLFTWRCTQTHCTNKHTHALYIADAPFTEKRQKFTKTHTSAPMHTHSMQQRAYSVRWQDELPPLYYQGDSSASNQWKQDESSYQRRKMQTWRESQNKMQPLPGICSSSEEDIDLTAVLKIISDLINISITVNYRTVRCA